MWRSVLLVPFSVLPQVVFETFDREQVPHTQVQRFYASKLFHLNDSITGQVLQDTVTGGVRDKRLCTFPNPSCGASTNLAL